MYKVISGKNCCYICNSWLLLTALLLSIPIVSQELKNKFGENYYTPALYKQEYKAAEGSPYLDEQFKPAKINNIEEARLVRFDAMNNQVEIMVKGNSVMILDDSEPYTIAMEDGSKKVYRIKSYTGKKGDKVRSFFQLLYEVGAIELYLKEEKRFYKEVKAQGYQDSQPAQFKKEPDTFFITDFVDNTDVLLEVPNRVNKFVELFAPRSKEMKEYIKDGKLELNKKDDLILIFTEYFGNNDTR